MKFKARYSIGEMSEICNISKKTLRYYDKIGLIASHRQDYNNYRYYTHDSLLIVPVLKYYKQMGFKLDEMRSFIAGPPNVYSVLRYSFMEKIKELRKEQEEIGRKYASVKDWHDLISEAEMVIHYNIHEVSIKYVEPLKLLYQDQEFDNDIKGAIINIDFTNYVEERQNEITGPVFLSFSSFMDRLENKSRKIRIMQQVLRPCEDEYMAEFGGCMMATCYHIGPHETIHEVYTKIASWGRKHNYVLGPESYERCVTDYWTTSNSAQFVTEVMVRVSREGDPPRPDGPLRQNETPGPDAGTAD